MSWARARGDLDLAGLAAEMMDAGIEGRIAAGRRIDAHGARDQSCGEDLGRGEEAGGRQHGGDLGAVEQRQPLLGREIQRLQPGPGEPVAGGLDATLDAHLALAHEGSAHMGERGQIARRPHRALGGDAGIDLGIDQGRQGLDGAAPHARGAAGEPVDLGDHDAPDQPILQQRTGAGGMGEDEAALELGHRLGGDAGLGQAAEAGIDAIGGAALLDDPAHHRRRGLHRGPSRGIDLDPAPVVQQPLEIAEGELAGTEPEDLIAHDQASPTCLYNFGLIACPRFREKPGPRKAAQVPHGTSVSAHVA